MESSNSYLLDTCVFLWAALDLSKLSPKAREIVVSPDATLYFSVASGWEILGKGAKGKLDIGAGHPADALRRHLAKAPGLRLLPLRMEHLYDAYRLPMLHRDPIDRMLIGQARTERMTLITPDEEIRKYDVPVLW